VVLKHHGHTGETLAGSNQSMTRPIGINRLLVMGLVAVAAALSLTQVAHAGPPAPEGLPPEIQVDEGPTRCS
jgi:hypothetical protein